MYNYTDKFREAVYTDKAKFKIIANLELASGHTLLLTESHIWQGTFSVESATSGSGEFSVGAAVASKLIFALNNNNDDFSSYDFIDAKISLQIGARLPDDTVEFDNYGIYTVTEASFSENSISITALDNLSKFSYPYGGEFAFPITLEQMMLKCCDACGVVLDAASVPSEMKTYTVEGLTADPSSLTYIGLISYAAQIVGCYAKADHSGRLAFGWYNTSLLAESYDGGTFEYNGRTYDDKPEAELDGGTFAYNDGDFADGGNFKDFEEIHFITAHISAEIATDDIRITGVRVVSSSNDSEKEPETAFVGFKGYVIEINSNPLISDGKCAIVAQMVYNNIGGMFFRPLSASILPDPAIEAGDVAFVVGKNDTPYPIFISSYKFCPDASCTIACDAQSKNRNGITNQNAVTVAIEEVKKWVAYEKSAREVALENMTTLMSNALGYHSTDVDMPGGGKITYIHNKTNLSDSSTQWKLTENGFMVSTDYGRTWRAGFDASGNAVVNVLSAVGINADWINAGTITGRKINNGNGTFYVDENGELTANSLKSNNAIITGGKINIKTDKESDNVIEINYGNRKARIAPVAINISDEGDREIAIVTPNMIIVTDENQTEGTYSGIYKDTIIENGERLDTKYAQQNELTNVRDEVLTITTDAAYLANQGYTRAGSALNAIEDHTSSQTAHNAENIELTGISNYKNVYECLKFLYSRVMGG